jgi:hypothetical protein
MRYFVALIIAGLVIGAIAVFAWQNYNLVQRSIRQHLRQQKERGELPPDLQGVDIESVDLRNYNVRVPADVMRRQEIARGLAASWFVWALGVVGISVAAAVLLGRWRSGVEKETADGPRNPL